MMVPPASETASPCAVGTTDFSTLLPRIQALKPDILCISNFGRDQQIVLKQATDFGVKKTTQIIAPLRCGSAMVLASAA